MSGQGAKKEKNLTKKSGFPQTARGNGMGWELLSNGIVLSCIPSGSFLYAVFLDPIACL